MRSASSMLRDTGPGDEQHVGVARAGDELDAQALEVVVGVVERVDLELAAVARARVDLADRQRAAEDARRISSLDRSPRASRHSSLGAGRAARSTMPVLADLQQDRDHQQVVPRVAQVEATC